MRLVLAVRAGMMLVIGPGARAQAGSSRRRFRGAAYTPSADRAMRCVSIRRMQCGNGSWGRGWIMRRHNHGPHDARSPAASLRRILRVSRADARAPLLRVLAPCSGI